MAQEQTKTEQILELAKKIGVLQIRDLTSRGIHPEYLRRLYKKGLLMRTGRGLYVAADAEISVHHGLAQACKRVPHGVICLLSALQFHEMGTQTPSKYGWRWTAKRHDHGSTIRRCVLCVFPATR